MNFFGELKRRNVTRVAGVYIVVGWILVQVATALEESLGLPTWFDGTIVALLLIGLPVAIIFAWAFELTPEGVVRTEAVPDGQSITTDTGRKLDYALSIAIVALVIVIIWQQVSAPNNTAAPTVAADSAVTTETSESAQPLDASVAVLPFADMSPEGDQEYFSDGLSEEILNLLVRAGKIEVASRTSAFQFKNTNLGIPEIAADLNVRHIVEGSVRKSGGTIRVTAQLIDTASDRHLWSNTYDRPLTAENVFEIQDDVANSIFAALSAELGFARETSVRAKRKTDNVDAYTLFLRARSLFEGRIDLDAADEFLQQATEMDPDFSEAWEYRAANQFLMHDYGYSDLPLSTLHERGLEFAQRALAIDPRSATAMAAISNIYVQQVRLGLGSHDWLDILEGYSKALEIDPRNASALNWRGLALGTVGNMSTALADFRHCVEYEPYYLPCRENLHWFLAETGQIEEAMRVFRESQDAGAAKSQFIHLGLLARTGNELMFKAATNDESALRGWRRHDELYDAFRTPDADHADLAASIADFFEANPGRDGSFIHTVLLPLGGARPLLDGYGIWGPSGQKLRQTDNFKDFITRVGIFDYWKTNGFPEICRPRGDNDFECD